MDLIGQCHAYNVCIATSRATNKTCNFDKVSDHNLFANLQRVDCLMMMIIIIIIIIVIIKSCEQRESLFSNEFLSPGNVSTPFFYTTVLFAIYDPDL